MITRCLTLDESYGFAGAENFPDGSRPVAANWGEALILAAGQTVEIHYAEELGYGDCLTIEFPTGKAAAAFISGLPDDMNPADYGFKRFKL